jgi:hypothetical protein
MYYSIPGVRKAVLRGDDVDLEDIKRSSPVVERRSIITFESIDMNEYANTDEPNPNEGSNVMDIDEEDSSSYLELLYSQSWRSIRSPDRK